MAQHTDYKLLSADQIRTSYHRSILLLWIGHLLTVFFLCALIGLLIAGKLLLNDFIFGVLFLVIGNVLLWQLRRVRFANLSSVLTQACDPVKLLQVLKKVRQPWVLHPDRVLLTARCEYYRGNAKEALAMLEDMQKPKPGKKPNLWVFQYYTLWISCCETLGDLKKIEEIREEVQGLTVGLAQNSVQMKQARQLFTLIDGVVYFARRDYQRCWEITDEMYRTSSFALTRIAASLRLAQIEHLRRANRSAIERCEYVIDDGGSTFFVQEAKQLLSICGGRSGSEEEEVCN